MAKTTDSSLRAQLKEERDRLADQLREIGRGPGGSLEFDEGHADVGQVTAERSEVDALSGQLRETFDDTEDALAKLDAGTYGDCESCGQPIAPARLEAMPAARLCITCASQRR